MPNLAVVLSGAVSLGSWEAGVLDELLFQLDRLNGDLAQGDRYRIDVITGASAGAMTAALVARAVMVDLADRRLLKDAWVDRIDITRLVQDIPATAILSKGPIEEIATRSLRAPSSATPSSIAPERLLLRFALSNMSGVDYALDDNPRPGAPPARFVTTFHAEQRQFALDAGNVLDGPTWDRIRGAAIASGNFPFAFAPQTLESDRTCWPGSSLDPFPERFTYVDGGLFNNEPLGEAVRLARLQDGTPERPGLDPSRKFLLVDANLNRSKRDTLFSDRSTLAETALRTLAVLLSESSATDWLRARRLNNEIGWRDDLLEVLAGLVKDTVVEDPAAFLAALEAAADRIVGQKRAIFPDRYPPDYRARAVDRTLDALTGLAAGMGETRLRIFGTLAFLVNSVAGLDKKDQLDLHVIYTTPEEAAGDRIRAFAGFFSHEWRMHDYTVGRRRANVELPWVLEGRTDPYPREPGVDYDPPDLGSVDMDAAPRAPRERLRDAMVAKADALARELKIGPAWVSWALGPLARWGLRRVVRTNLEKVLELRK